MQKLYHFLLSALLVILLASWGGTGHYIISLAASNSFNDEMNQFMGWANYLAGHASDADNRKSSDPAEAPKHYIDIDNYTEFNSNQTMPFTMADAINRYGYSFVIDNGTLPWATKTTYDSLVVSLRTNRIDKAKQFAADLGHYVADGHMPLHITKNYNGQLTGNTGIHSRYESTMINAHADEFYNLELRSIEYITNVQQYIFEYIYFNYQFVDSILQADNYAKSVNPDYSSTAYKDALWEKTNGFTRKLFSNASQRLAELIYSAWIDAGRPSVSTGIEAEKNRIHGMKIYPNPTVGNLNVEFYASSESSRLDIYDVSGFLIESTFLKSNPNSVQIYANSIYLNDGIYLFRVTSGNSSQTQKVVIQKK